MHSGCRPRGVCRVLKPTQASQVSEDVASLEAGSLGQRKPSTRGRRGFARLRGAVAVRSGPELSWGAAWTWEGRLPFLLPNFLACSLGHRVFLGMQWDAGRCRILRLKNIPLVFFFLSPTPPVHVNWGHIKGV